MIALPPLRIPRTLLDPRRTDLPPADADGLVTVVLEHQGGRLTALESWHGQAGDHPLAVTPFPEPHAHLDKAFSGRRHPNREGTMAGALAANFQEAEHRSGEQVLARGERALDRAWRCGVRAIRTHIDSLGPAAEASWEALETLRRSWAGRVELQLVALVPIHHWLSPAGEALARRVAGAGGVLGGVLGMPYAVGPTGREALLSLLRLAERFGCGIDLHVDESDGDDSRGQGVRLVSDLLQRHRIAVPLVCSHASSMGLLGDRNCRRLAEAMAASGVAVVALPSTNLWLLGKRQGRTPWRRPQAPIRQLQEAGVVVAVGGDNVQDPWFPGGDFDPVALLSFCLPASHLVPWQRQGLGPFTTAAAQLLALEWDGVLREGGPADLVVLGASTWQELLARTPRRRVLRDGHWLPPPELERPSPLLDSLPG